MRVLGEVQGLDYSHDSETMDESLNQYSWALSSLSSNDHAPSFL